MLIVITLYTAQSWVLYRLCPLFHHPAQLGGQGSPEFRSRVLRDVARPAQTRIEDFAWRGEIPVVFGTGISSTWNRRESQNPPVSTCHICHGRYWVAVMVSYWVMAMVTWWWLSGTQCHILNLELSVVFNSALSSPFQPLRNEQK